MVKCDLFRNQRGRFVLRVWVQSETRPELSSYTDMDPGRYLSQRDLTKAVQLQAARVAAHLCDTVGDSVDPAVAAHEAEAALAAGVIEYDKRLRAAERG